MKNYIYFGIRILNDQFVLEGFWGFKTILKKKKNKKKEDAKNAVKHVTLHGQGSDIVHMFERTVFKLTVANFQVLIVFGVVCGTGPKLKNQILWR